jgi:protein-S-isoprenylcysteine O-methyltransferase Ste14
MRSLPVQMMEYAFVWSGAAAFVGSLALCTVTYLLVFDREASPHGWQPIAIDLVLFTVFAAHHSVFAREGVKRTLRSLMPSHLIRSVYVWTASALLVLVCVAWQPVGGEWYTARGLAAIGHAGVQLTGVWLIAWSVAEIDPLELAGIRQESRTTDLKIGGPYKLVRHPLYLGWILAVFGTARMTGDRLAFASMTSFYLLIAIPWEERSLGRTFGEAYSRYKAAVRWRVLPFIY